jgi:LAO/AO transport system kinase
MPADQALLDGVRRGDRRALAKAITLLESTRADHRRRADALLDALLPQAGRSVRIGISGVPGAGKSTFIEALGLLLIARGHRLAVLAVDPSSKRSGGSILADKTRMERLSVRDEAYIRPSPTAGTLGGVAEHTREAMLVCEAAGFDVVIVETVGVGQSETAVAAMTDLFVLLQLPNAGDELQAIKRGVMEVADLVVVNKADLDPAAATRAQAQLAAAAHAYGSRAPSEAPDAPAEAAQVLQASALTEAGVAGVWEAIEARLARARSRGAFEARRRRQATAWMWDMIAGGLQAAFRADSAVKGALPKLVAEVAGGRVAPSVAARQLLERWAGARGAAA